MDITESQIPHKAIGDFFKALECNILVQAINSKQDKIDLQSLVTSVLTQLLNPNWKETDPTKKSYIQNKPTSWADLGINDVASVGYVATYVATYVTTALANMVFQKANWTQNNSSANDFIKNKPTTWAALGIADVVSTEMLNTAITNALANIPFPAQIQTNWNTTDEAAASFLKGKPSTWAALGIADVASVNYVATYVATALANYVPPAAVIPEQQQADLDEDAAGSVSFIKGGRATVTGNGDFAVPERRIITQVSFWDDTEPAGIGIDGVLVEPDSVEWSDGVAIIQLAKPVKEDTVFTIYGANEDTVTKIIWN